MSIRLDEWNLQSKLEFRNLNVKETLSCRRAFQQQFPGGDAFGLFHNQNGMVLPFWGGLR